ncbi:hypothetical protein ABFZ85_12145 [Hyphococcus formosus]|uniref:hypothetical protein n=1 Tax=Hyphococcus formosus TaxID=3143534 RepID=UPI00398A9AA6
MSETIKIKYDLNLKVFEYEGPYDLFDAILKRLSESDVLSLSSDDSQVGEGRGANAEKTKLVKDTKKTAPSRESENRTPRKSTSSRNKGRSGVNPKYNSELDLLKLPAFLNELVLKNNTEYVVAFVVFLAEELKLKEISSDDIYTCFCELKTKVKMPKSIDVPLKDAKNKHHVITYEAGFNKITLPAKGSNFFHHDIKKRTRESGDQ